MELTSEQLGDFILGVLDSITDFPEEELPGIVKEAFQSISALENALALDGVRNPEPARRIPTKVTTHQVLRGVARAKAPTDAEALANVLEADQSDVARILHALRIAGHVALMGRTQPRYMLTLQGSHALRRI
jgi:hypothetical protein